MMNKIQMLQSEYLSWNVLLQWTIVWDFKCVSDIPVDNGKYCINLTPPPINVYSLQDFTITICTVTMFPLFQWCYEYLIKFDQRQKKFGVQAFKFLKAFSFVALKTERLLKYGYPLKYNI